MRKKGFTLLEISAVLLIIGLIVGGITVGNDIIRQAKLRNVMTELNNLNASFNSFSNIYTYKPGDFPKASLVWPTACLSADPNAANNKCNGDGDGRILRGTSTTGYENLRVMQHMHLAGLLEGLSKTDGYVVSSAIREQAGINVPAAQSYKGAGYQINSADEQSIIFQAMGDILTFTGYDATTGWLIAPVITPKDAFYIDTKMDDGNPGRGIIFAGNLTTTNGNCTSPILGTNTGNVSYAFTETTNSCAIIYWINKYRAT